LRLTGLTVNLETQWIVYVYIFQHIPVWLDLAPIRQEALTEVLDLHQSLNPQDTYQIQLLIVAQFCLPNLVPHETELKRLAEIRLYCILAPNVASLSVSLRESTALLNHLPPTHFS